MQEWMHKLVYFEERGNDWGPWMVDSMPMLDGDKHSDLPMPDFVDVLAMRGWEVVTALPVNHPKANLLLLIFKRPRDWKPQSAGC